MARNAVLVMGCSDSKRPTSNGKAPGLQLYDGPMFRTLRAWCQHHPLWPTYLDIYVLSGKHGFVSALTPIESYDHRLRMADIDALDSPDQRALVSEATKGAHPQVLFAGGPLYHTLFTRLCPPDLEWQWTGDNWPRGKRGGIGQHRVQLNRWLDAIPKCEPSIPEPADHPA